MNWADWTIIGVLVISGLIGLKRGFVKEVLALLCWIAALFVAVTFADSFEVLLTQWVETPSLRRILAFGGLFVLTLLVGSLINFLITELVRITGLSGTDRLLGLVFGVARGGVLTLLIVLLVPRLLPVGEDEWWQQSLLIPQFLAMESWASAVWSDLTAAAAKSL